MIAGSAPRLTVLALSALVALVAPAGAAAQASATGPAPAPAVPTFAVEDTIPVPSAFLPVQVVTAPRVTLDEILRRVAAGEAHRDSLMQDQSFTMLAALTYLDESKDGTAATKRQWEYAGKVYRKRPDKVRTIALREKSNFRKQDAADIQVGPNMGEELVNFAFQPRTRARFNFAIQERHLVAGRVVYLVGFTPKSKLDDLPTGRAWIDTKDFVIVRQEFWYRDRSPSPLVFKSIDSCVLERAQVDGRWWVMTRLMARVQITSLARFLARVGKEKLSPTVDFTLSLKDWQVNRGIDDAVFTGGAK